MHTPETIADDVPRSAKAGSRWGWGLCWLLFGSTALSYMDRQAVAVVGERLTAEFGVGFESLGRIIAKILASDIPAPSPGKLSGANTRRSHRRADATAPRRSRATGLGPVEAVGREGGDQ